MYIDETYIFPLGFKQTIIILFYDELTKIKYPGAYILINSKLYQGYLLAFNAFNNIITKYNSINIKLESITIDFEEGLIKALHAIYPKIKLIGCFFHYMFNLDKKARFYELYKYENIEIKNILKKLGSIPFLFTKEKNSIEITFNNIKDKYKKDEKKYKDLLEDIGKYEVYYKTQWLDYLKNGMLNYYKIEKFRRSNSYIGNYNKHLKTLLKPFIYKNKNSKIDWIFFLGVLIDEENTYRNKFLESINKEEINIFDKDNIKDYEEEFLEDNNLYNNVNIKNDFELKVTKQNTIKSKINYNITNTLYNFNNNNKSNINIIANYSNNKEINNGKEEILTWLLYNNLSCRYDAFFLYIQI